MCARCDENPAFKIFLGHDGPPTNWYFENLLTGERLTECPLRTILRRSEEQPILAREVDEAIDHITDKYWRRFLLVAGGKADQPARWNDIVTMVGRVRAATEAKDIKLREKKREQESGAG